MLPIYGELSPQFTEKPDEIEPEIWEDSPISYPNRSSVGLFILPV
jgi:hypothetical protein